MKGWIILAEAATSHPDGTISMLRAGIDKIEADSTPILIRGTLVASIEGEAGERGPHKIQVNCIDEDGKDQLPTIDGQFDLPAVGGKNTLILGLQAQLKRFGTYQFNLVVDRAQLASWTLRAMKRMEEQHDGNNSSE